MYLSLIKNSTLIKKLLDNFNILEHLELWLLGTFLLALYIAYRSYGPIIYIAIKKHLVDEPDKRSVHTNNTPTLGGVGIFISLILVMSLAGSILNSRNLLILAGGITLLFFLGLKDDLLVLSPRKKFLGQLLASFLFVTITDVRILGFSNILSVEVLPYWVSIGFTVFVFVLIINAYNLIDGIDGLAGSVALLASLVFGMLFYQASYIGSATLTFALAGALIAFLRLNFSKKNKIFMGDTGSLIVGFMLAVFAVSYISYSQGQTALGAKDSSPIMAVAILFFPLMDTLRIFFIRIVVHKTSPFLADKNHIHHRLLSLGYSHKQTTVIIIILNALVIGFGFAIANLEIHLQLLLLVGFGLMLFLLPFLKKAKNRPAVKLRHLILKLKFFINSF